MLLFVMVAPVPLPTTASGRTIPTTAGPCRRGRPIPVDGGPGNALLAPTRDPRTADQHRASQWSWCESAV